MVNQYTPLIDRFMASFCPEPNSGCWLWTGAVRRNAHDLRPAIANKGRVLIGYRVAWELLRGPIPEGAFICHKCDVSLCVNPDHLYVGDAFSNSRDMFARGHAYSQRYPEKARANAIKLGRRNTWCIGNNWCGIIIPREDYDSICERLRSGESKTDIARSYGVGRGAVYQYLKRRVARTALRNAGRG